MCWTRGYANTNYDKKRVHIKHSSFFGYHRYASLWVMDGQDVLGGWAEQYDNIRPSRHMLGLNLKITRDFRLFLMIIEPFVLL